jgi:hypothetical protein
MRDRRLDYKRQWEPMTAEDYVTLGVVAIGLILIGLVILNL